MKIFAILLMIFFSIKSLFYAKYELTANKNKSGAIAIAILSISGFIFSTYILCI